MEKFTFDGDDMISWMREVWTLPRSLTGNGTLETLRSIQNIHPNLVINSISSGEEVFDWVVPDEWQVEDAFIEDKSGNRYAEFKKNNLHLVGYSNPVQETVSKEMLLSRVHTAPHMRDAIPYVTSYYKDYWGFCMSERERSELPDGPFKVVIKSAKFKGNLNYGELLIPGKIKAEIFFSTYICHPSMANNELSGPALAIAIADYIKKKHPDNYFSYRIIFVPETIGAVCYLDANLKYLKKNMVAGFNLSCVGDEREYSHIQSPDGNNMADQALSAALLNKENSKIYSFLTRGSDERQYCAPNIALPVCGFSKSKYATYPEYHTSLDNFDLVTARGLTQSLSIMSSVILAFESGIYPKTTTYGEPQLGKRGLYPNLSKADGSAFEETVRTRMDLLAYADGKRSLFQICKLIGKNLRQVLDECRLLKEHDLLELKR